MEKLEIDPRWEDNDIMALITRVFKDEAVSFVIGDNIFVWEATNNRERLNHIQSAKLVAPTNGQLVVSLLNEDVKV